MKHFQKVEAFVLTGGHSSRMGRDKALLEIEGVPLLVRTARLVDPLVAGVTVVGAPERYGTLGLRAIPDAFEGIGPLGGLATALQASRSEWSFVVGCDLPGLTAEWLEWFFARAVPSAADALLPSTARGVEPLCAMYRTRCATRVAAATIAGVRKVTDGLADLEVQHVSEEEWKTIASGEVLFKNVNTPADYDEVRKRLRGKESE